MSSEYPTLQAGEIDQSFTNLLKPLESTETSCQTIRKEADQLISLASEKIRRNPLPAVAGAFAFGIAIGCAIMSGRQSASNDSFDLREPLAETGDILGRSLRAMYENLKFW